MALYNASILTGALVIFRMSLFGRTIRATIINVRRTLRATEIERDGTENSDGLSEAGTFTTGTRTIS